MSQRHSLAALALAAGLLLGGCGGPSDRAEVATTGAGSTPAVVESGEPGASDGSASADPEATSTRIGGEPETDQTSCLDMAKEMSREAQIGQLLMVGTTELEPGSAVEQAVTKDHVGSVLYLGSLDRSLIDTSRTSEDLQGRTNAEPPLLFATDQEGGQVQRLDGEGFTEIPNATQQGKLSDAELRKKWATWGREMKEAGVLYDLAPVADVVPPGEDAGNAAVGALDRNYGTDDQTVAAKATAVVQGLADAGLASSLKHYPGLGRAAANTDFGTAVDERTTLDDAASFLGPMEAGASSVMISSTIYPKIDPGVHAVFSSKIITDGLRGKHGWEKVVISDDLGAAAAVKEVPVSERGARFIAAGGDLVINADAATIGDMADGIAQRADEDQAFADALPEHAARVLALKAEVGLVQCTA